MTMTAPNHSQQAAHPAVVAKRGAHALNDARVTLRAGATTKSRYAMGATISGGGGLVGVVHGVAGDVAVVDFGVTAAGTQLGQMIVSVADLEVAS